jgi:hypothetical protein
MAEDSGQSVLSSLHRLAHDIQNNWYVVTK